MKLRAGYVAFIPPGDPYQDYVFQKSLQRISQVVNEIVIVWGRFKGREDLPPRPPPRYLQHVPYCRAKVKVIYSDLKLPQPQQRDLYLPGLEDGDILLVMDADWVPVFSRYPEVAVALDPKTLVAYMTVDEKMEQEVLPTESEIHDWDALMVDIFYPDGKWQCGIICVYRYRPGMKHGPGQLLEIDGIPITTPNYKVLLARPVRYFHVKGGVKGE